MISDESRHVVPKCEIVKELDTLQGYLENTGYILMHVLLHFTIYLFNYIAPSLKHQTPSIYILSLQLLQSQTYSKRNNIGKIREMKIDYYSTKEIYMIIRLNLVLDI